MTKEEAIYKILKESSLSQMVKNRIFPLVAPLGTDKYPFIVYSQTSRRTQGTKDGDNRMLVIAVSVVAKSYKEAHDISLDVQRVFFDDHTTSIEETVGFRDFQFESETELYDLQTDTYMVKTEISYEYNI
jgi:hypothetical protein